MSHLVEVGQAAQARERGGKHCLALVGEDDDGELLARAVATERFAELFAGTARARTHGPVASGRAHKARLRSHRRVPRERRVQCERLAPLVPQLIPVNSKENVYKYVFIRYLESITQAL
jgi:hypothetical protein